MTENGLLAEYTWSTDFMSLVALKKNGGALIPLTVFIWNNSDF